MQCCDMTKRSKKAWMKWRRLLSEQSRSGQSVKAFCREHGLCRPYFFVWKKRLEEDTSKKFLEVQVAGGGARTPRGSSVGNRLRDGGSLVGGPGFDGENVGGVLGGGGGAGGLGWRVLRRGV